MVNYHPSQSNGLSTKYRHINFDKYNGGMKRFQVPRLTREQLAELEELSRKAPTSRYQPRTQIILLSAEKGLKVEEIGDVVAVALGIADDGLHAGRAPHPAAADRF